MVGASFSPIKSSAIGGRELELRTTLRGGVEGADQVGRQFQPLASRADVGQETVTDAGARKPRLLLAPFRQVFTLTHIEELPTLVEDLEEAGLFGKPTSESSGAPDDHMSRIQ